MWDQPKTKYQAEAAEVQQERWAKSGWMDEPNVGQKTK